MKKTGQVYKKIYNLKILAVFGFPWENHGNLIKLFPNLTICAKLQTR